jgi:hypothetical protein
VGPREQVKGISFRSLAAVVSGGASWNMAGGGGARRMAEPRREAAAGRSPRPRKPCSLFRASRPHTSTAARAPSHNRRLSPSVASAHSRSKLVTPQRPRRRATHPRLVPGVSGPPERRHHAHLSWPPVALLPRRRPYSGRCRTPRRR